MKFKNVSTPIGSSTGRGRRGRRLLVTGLVLAASALALGGGFGLRGATGNDSPPESASAPTATAKDTSTRSANENERAPASGDPAVAGEPSTRFGQRRSEGPAALALDATEAPPQLEHASTQAFAVDSATSSATSASSFACGDGSGMIDFYLPFTTSGDFHRFFYRVDGGEWFWTNWYYTEGYEHRWEYVYPGEWQSILSGMSFVKIGGGHTVEAWEYSSSTGWTDFGSCQTWSVDSGGVFTNQECLPTSPNYHWDPITSSGYCVSN